MSKVSHKWVCYCRETCKTNLSVKDTDLIANPFVISLVDRPEVQNKCRETIPLGVNMIHDFQDIHA